MKGESGSGFFRDDGTAINPDLIRKPGLCITCRKDDDPQEEILCTLTRADQRGEEVFQCEALCQRVPPKLSRKLRELHGMTD